MQGWLPMIPATLFFDIQQLFPKADNSNPNSGILNRGASNTKGNHNTNSLKENLKEGL